MIIFDTNDNEFVANFLLKNFILSLHSFFILSMVTLQTLLSNNDENMDENSSTLF